VPVIPDPIADHEGAGEVACPVIGPEIAERPFVPAIDKLESAVAALVSPSVAAWSFPASREERSWCCNRRVKMAPDEGGLKDGSGGRFGVHFELDREGLVAMR